MYYRYFPSYTLGAMMAAQLFETAEKAIPDLRGKIAKGNVPCTIFSYPRVLVYLSEVLANISFTISSYSCIGILFTHSSHPSPRY